VLRDVSTFELEAGSGFRRNCVKVSDILWRKVRVGMLVIPVADETDMFP
jgi:hypothetical protein